MLLLAGDYDVGLPPRNAAEYAGLFEQAGLAAQPGTGHFPGSAIPCGSRGRWRLSRLIASSSSVAATVAPHAPLVRRAGIRDGGSPPDKDLMQGT